jgi:hypothetical protein
VYLNAKVYTGTKFNEAAVLCKDIITNSGYICNVATKDLFSMTTIEMELTERIYFFQL